MAKRKPKRGPGSEWITRVPAGLREEFDAAIDDDKDGRRETATAIYRRIFALAPYTTLRSFQTYVRIRRGRRDNAAVGNFSRAVVGGKVKLDDVHAIAVGRLLATVQSGKLKGYELAKIVSVIQQARRADIAAAADERKQTDWEERRKTVEARLEKIGKTERLKPEVMKRIREEIYGIFDAAEPVDAGDRDGD